MFYTTLKAPIPSISDSLRFYLDEFTFFKKTKHSPSTYPGTWAHSVKSLMFNVTTVITVKQPTEVRCLNERQQSLSKPLWETSHVQIFIKHFQNARCPELKSAWEHEKGYKTRVTD